MDKFIWKLEYRDDYYVLICKKGDVEVSQIIERPNEKVILSLKRELMIRVDTLLDLSES